LIVDDNEGYREFVCKLRQRAGQTEDPFAACVLARTAVTSAEPIVEPAQLTRWAEQAVANDRNAWCLHALGFAHYRAGRFDEAIKRLDELNAKPWVPAGT
jgi:hypothetical protein